VGARLRSYLAASCVVVLATQSAAGSEPRTEASDAVALKLIAQCKAASGGAALDRPAAFHEAGTIVRDGHAGTYEMYADLHALRTAGIHTLDGKVGGGGFDGQSAWHVGADGKVVISHDAAELAGERSGAYVTIGGYFYPDRFPARFRYLGRKAAGGASYDVIEVAPAQALPVSLWLDLRTHRLERLSAADGAVQMEGEVLAYRRVAGTWIGFKNRQREGDHTMVQTLATYDYVPLDPARFAPPAPPH